MSDNKALSSLLNSISCGNHADLLPEIPPNCIDLTITSPPYDKLRDYKGYTFDHVNLGKELYRITKDGGVVVWIVGDSVSDGNQSLTSFRQALDFQEMGFNVYDVIIYAKKSPSLPIKNRYLNAFEYMFIFSKDIPKTVHLIHDRKNKQAGNKMSGRTKRNKDGTTEPVSRPYRLGKYSRRYNIWEYLTGYNHTTKDEIAFQHPAMFPEKLARDHIYSWSNPGDVVLDPMCGSGTVAKMAHLMNRNYIGIDISEEYCEIARKRLAEYQHKAKPNSHWDQVLNLNEKERATIRMDRFFSD